jgi:hypothetical protein
MPFLTAPLPYPSTTPTFAHCVQLSLWSSSLSPPYPIPIYLNPPNLCPHWHRRTRLDLLLFLSIILSCSLILESVFPSAFSNEFILLWANNNNNNKTLLLHLQSRMISFETNIDYCVGIFISGARNGRWLLSIKPWLAFRQQGVWGLSYALGENGPG